MATISFIGLGKMGKPMVKNLLKHQHIVKVFDISRVALEQCVNGGAIGAQSPAEAVKGADVAITMLQTGDQVREVCLGKEGILNHLPQQSLYIDCSSIDIEVTRKLHAEAKNHHIAMLDAPVSGGVKGAINGTLTFMVGGEPADFKKAKAFLQAMGKLVIYAGAASSGQAAKICNNMILGISMIAVSEGFTLGKKLGLDPKNLFEICSHASAQCWSMTNYCPVPNIIEDVPSNHDYQPGFTSAMMLKDLKLSQNAAKSVNIETHLGATATTLYQKFVENNHAELDFSGIIKMIDAEDQD